MLALDRVEKNIFGAKGTLFKPWKRWRCPWSVRSHTPPWREVSLKKRQDGKPRSKNRKPRVALRSWFREWKERAKNALRWQPRQISESLGEFLSGLLERS